MAAARSTRALKPSRNARGRHLRLLSRPLEVPTSSSSAASARSVARASLYAAADLAGMLPLPGFGVQWTVGEPGAVPPVMLDRRDGLPIDHRRALFLQVGFIVFAILFTQILFA